MQLKLAVLLLVVCCKIEKRCSCNQMSRVLGYMAVTMGLAGALAVLQKCHHGAAIGIGRANGSGLGNLTSQPIWPQNCLHLSELPRQRVAG